MEILLGIVPSVIIAFIAYRKGSLNKSGAIAAILLGAAIFSLGGFVPYILMISFFISSSIFSKVGRKQKKYLDKIHDKGDKRDYIQVLANGGIALLCLILFQLTKNINYFIASAVSFAASTSDTWASELGVLSKGKTISLIKGKHIEKGISGGVSIIGTFSALCGAFFIAIIYIIFHVAFLGFDIEVVKIFFIIGFFGFLGSIIDSVIGDTLQGQYKDNKSGIITEKKYSKNGMNTLVKGCSAINNDIVNITSNLIVTILAIFLL